MSVAGKLRGLFGGGRDGDARPKIRVKLFLSGRIGAGWQNIDRDFTLAAGSTLADLLYPLREARSSARDPASPRWAAWTPRRSGRGAWHRGSRAG